MKRILPYGLCLVLWATPVIGGENDTTLSQSVAAAVQQHPTVKGLIHNREAMSRNMKASFGRFFPSVDLYSSVGYQDYNNATTSAATYTHDQDFAADTTLKLTQNLFDGMDRWNTYQAAKERLNSAEYRLINDVETVGLDAVQSHVDVSRQRILANLAEKNVEKLKEVLSSINERVEAGAGNRADEMQARGRVARAETTLVTYLGDLRIAEANYLRVTGAMPVELGEPEYDAEAPESMQMVMDSTLANNPLVHVYESDLEALKKDKNVDRASYMPTIDLELSGRYAEDIDSDTSYVEDYRAMLVASWNLYRGGSDYQTVKSSEARINQTNADLKDTIDGLNLESATAWNEYLVAMAQITKYGEALDYSMQSLDMYLEQFNVGQRSLLDVLDAINEVFNTAVLLKTAESNRVFSLYKFKALEGNLLYTLNLDTQSYADATYDN